ncbi:ABC transporter ATP-binding protein [uncultured Fibrobacter sp.]|uniref:ABC transporter ATP-binding protein n=1 Tax=uncultured Fibrobacter sp. TaxID=261512 RepID=UPI0025E47E17|nr:ABC transporter ATP-binding protein [uncultured Fibrobacter sp.]
MNITLKKVSFSYTDSIYDAVLKDISLQINSGECVVLAGESGSGKTTISKLINGLIPLYQSGTMAGDVLLGDKNTSDITLAEISKYVGSVFQNPRSQFFNVDTDSEIAFGCENLGIKPEEIRRRIEKTVTDFHLESLLGRNIFHLSGGEKQKIACASVDATDPDIFVLDEPSANLDLKTVADLAEIIKIWKSRGKTVVVVEHRLHYLRDVADRIIYVKEGHIECEWTPAELESKGAEYAASLGLRCMNLEQLSKSGNAGRHVHDENSVISSRKAEPATNELWRKQPFNEILVFNDLHFAYNPKFPILDIPMLALHRGQITALLGHNGAGKSTLAQLVCGLNGSRRQKRVAHKLGTYLIMQDVNHQLFTESVLDEVLLGMDPKDESAALEILDSLNLKNYAEKHPMALSGGQKQRVAIASGVSSNRNLIVFDEPTSGLDYRQMLAVSATLKALANRGKTLFVITHDPELVLNCCHHVIHMDHGRIVDEFPLQGNENKLIHSLTSK